LSEKEGRKRKRRVRRKPSLQVLVDQQLLYQLQVENMAISTALKLDEWRIKRRVHDSYVS